MTRPTRSALLGGWSCAAFGLAASIWLVSYLNASAQSGTGPHALGASVLLELVWTYAIPGILLVGLLLALLGLERDVPSIWSRCGAVLNALGLVLAIGGYLVSL